jgi:hypothetical protein
MNPIPDGRIMDAAAGQIGLEGDEFDLALDYAADQGWFEDAEVDDGLKERWGFYLAMRNSSGSLAIFAAIRRAFAGAFYCPIWEDSREQAV